LGVNVLCGHLSGLELEKSGVGAVGAAVSCATAVGVLAGVLATDLARHDAATKATEAIDTTVAASLRR
jgi:hypothetical protein